MLHRIFVTLFLLFSIGLYAQGPESKLFGISETTLTKWHQISLAAHEDPSKHLSDIRGKIDALPADNLRERIFAEFVLIGLKLTLENSPEALADLERIEKDILALPEPIYTARMYSLKSRAFDNMGRYLEGLNIIEKALKIAEPLGVEIETARIRVNRGQVKYSQGRFTDSLDDFLYAYRVFKEKESEVELGSTVASIAQVYSKTGQHLEAIEYYKESLKLINKDKQKLYASIIYFNIGIAYDRVDEFQLAAFFFKDALKLSEELDDRVGMAYAWNQLGNLSQSQTHYEEAIEYFQKSYDVFAETQDRKLLINVSLSIAEVKSILGEYQSAIEQVTSSLQLAEEYEISEGVVGAHRVAAFVYEQSGQYRKALTHHKTYAELREKSYMEQNKLSLNELKVSFDTEAEKAQNILLEKQNSMNQLEIARQHAEKRTLWALIALFTFLVLFIVVILWRQIQVRKRFASLALTDELTGAPNRRNVVEFARRQLDVALATNTSMLLAIIDLDKFKEVNDNFGHDVGDELLKQFFKRGNSALRNVDRMGRYGGEEWLVIMPGFPPNKVSDVFVRIRDAVNKSPIDSLPSDRLVTFSMGAVLSKSGDSINNLLKKADDALYEAKGGGRDKWVLYEASK